MESGETGIDYMEKAFIALNDIMGHGRNMFENLNRTNRGEIFVLHFLATHDAEVLPSELSTALKASTARISAVLGALEKKGQIARDIDKSNRRNILVTITEAGRNRAAAEMAEIKESMMRVFADMGEGDTTAFIRLLRQFFELSQKHIKYRLQ